MKALAFSFHMHESTLSKIIKETSSAIWNALQKDYLAPPSREKWIEIAREFEIKWNFPLCLGALDGKHIPIKVNRIFDYLSIHHIALAYFTLFFKNIFTYYIQRKCKVPAYKELLEKWFRLFLCTLHFMVYNSVYFLHWCTA